MRQQNNQPIRGDMRGGATTTEANCDRARCSQYRRWRSQYRRWRSFGQRPACADQSDGKTRGQYDYARKSQTNKQYDTRPLGHDP